VHRLARYIGAPREIIDFAGFRLNRLRAFEATQRALKFFELARTGHTTIGILDLADELLRAAASEASPKGRHRLRNQAAILGIYAVAPLRNASADIVFGQNLFWEGEEWVIDMEIQKTQNLNPEHFVYPLAPEHGRFIDAVILGDLPAAMLPVVRTRMLAAQRQLFVLHDGTPTAPRYIPRLFKEITDNSFTTLRTMLHTDLGVAHGTAGTEMAMAAEHQTSHATASKYQADVVRRAGARRTQERARQRRIAAQSRQIDQQGP
jgi:hypothetical protein